MAARAGVRKQDVIDVAADLLAQRGSIDELPLRDVADELGVRTQSLYAHVDGIDGLRRELAVRGLAELAARLSEAAIGRSGGDAVDGIVRAWLAFAEGSPGLYTAALRPPGDDEALGEAMAATMKPLRLVLGSYGLDDRQVGHWHRLLFATVHGFATLRREGAFTLPGSSDDTIDRMIAVFTSQLESERSPR
jgi:AcrR family transcriptional regulator